MAGTRQRQDHSPRAAPHDLQRGPDGPKCAVGGEVPIRLPETTDYKQAIKDAQQKLSALPWHPADPSPDDYAAAAAFRQRALEARAKLSNEESASPPPRAKKKRMQRTMSRNLRRKVTSKTPRALKILPSFSKRTTSALKFPQRLQRQV